MTGPWSAASGGAIDTRAPCTDPGLAEHDLNVAHTMRAALRHARLTAERSAVEAAVPPDVSLADFGLGL